MNIFWSCVTVSTKRLYVFVVPRWKPFLESTLPTAINLYILHGIIHIKVSIFMGLYWFANACIYEYLVWMHIWIFGETFRILTLFFLKFSCMYAYSAARSVVYMHHLVSQSKYCPVYKLHLKSSYQMKSEIYIMRKETSFKTLLLYSLDSISMLVISGIEASWFHRSQHLIVI